MGTGTGTRFEVRSQEDGVSGNNVLNEICLSIHLYGVIPSLREALIHSSLLCVFHLRLICVGF